MKNDLLLYKKTYSDYIKNKILYICASIFLLVHAVFLMIFAYNNYYQIFLIGSLVLLFFIYCFKTIGKTIANNKSYLKNNEEYIYYFLYDEISHNEKLRNYLGNSTINSFCKKDENDFKSINHVLQKVLIFYGKK